MNKKSRLALAFMGMVGLISAPALAAGVTAKVTQVESFQNGLYLQVSGVNYVATTNAGSACSSFNVNVDTLKAWQSQGQAALLSGHSVTLYFGTCGGTSYIQDVVLTAS